MNLLLGYVEGEQVEQVIVRGTGLHRIKACLRHGGRQILDGSQSCDIAEQLLDGVGLLQALQRPNLNLQCPRRPTSGSRCRRWCWRSSGCGHGCCHGGRGRSWWHWRSGRRCLAGSEFCNAPHQIRRGHRLALPTRLVTRQQAARCIGRIQQYVDHGGNWLQLMATQTVEQRLHLVGQLRYVGKTKRGRSALDRMGAAEDAVEFLIIRGAQIEIEQHLLHLVEVFTGLLKEDLVELAQVEICTCACSFVMGIRHLGSCCVRGFCAFAFQRMTF